MVFSSSSAQRFYIVIASILLIVSVVLAFAFDGTNGSGDTVFHYLMAKYSWQHPYLFFDHWGKPVFTMLSSPFAQLGFNFVKLYNILIYFGAFLITLKLAQLTLPAYAWWTLPIFFCAPDAVGAMFSSLTEPTFAILFAWSLWALKNNHWTMGICVASFLPMARSEGLVVLFVYAVYILLNQKYYHLPLLLFGQFVIALAGIGVYENIFWVFTEMPYATTQSNYSSGSIWHYSRSLPYVLGIASSVLLYFAFVWYVLRMAKKLFVQCNWTFTRNIRFLIYGSFAAFLFSHSLLFYLGSFNDMGLIRVFTAMMPGMAIMAIDGVFVADRLLFNKIKKYRSHIAATVVLLMIVFGFFASVYAFNYKKALLPTPTQLFYSNTLVPYLERYYPNHKLYFSDTEIAFRHGVNIFEETPYTNMIATRKPDYNLSQQELIIWDSWYSVVEEHITLVELQQHPNLQQDTVFEVNEPKYQSKIAIFTRKN